jgi:predicted transcriptional regulator
MTVKDIAEKLNLTLLGGRNGLSNSVTGVYVSDLLSDVMGNATEGMVWVTLQTHKNVIAVASLKDLAGVIVVKNLPTENATINEADNQNTPLLATPLSTFEITGILYNLIHP